MSDRSSGRFSIISAMRKIFLVILVFGVGLLIGCGGGEVEPPAAADTLAGYLENAQVSKIFMPDVGHYPPLEVPARFAQLVISYLEVATPE